MTPPLEHDHSSEAIAERLSAPPTGANLRDWVLGGIDGAVTTFAVVAGVAGAELSTRIILILGAANLLADGFSMAAGNYAGVKAENDDYERLREMERRHILEAPEGEREEVRQIFAAKGFAGEDLERAVEIITSRHERWVQLMMEEEHGAPRHFRSPRAAAMATFAAFVIAGAVPLLPFAFGAGEAGLAPAAIMTAATFFLIGAMKSKWSPHPWWRSGLETVAIGLAAAALAYFTGAALHAMFGAAEL